MPDQLDEQIDPQRQSERVTETIAAILLSIAALASSYAAFQSDLWDGEQAANYTLAEQARTGSSKDSMVAFQFATIDVMTFTQWIEADRGGDEQLSRFYRERFRPPFRDAFEKWLALRPLVTPNAPTTPFALPGYYQSVHRDAGAKALEADRLFAKGQRANRISDTYGQAGLVLAMSLFLGGIVQGFNLKTTRQILLTLSGACLFLGLVRMAFLPAIRLI